MKSTIIFAFLLNLLAIQCGTFTCQAQKKTRTTSTARKQTKTTSSANAEFQRLLAKANKGDAEAQATIGWNYCVGVGVPQDMTKGMNWLEKSIENGNGNACWLASLVYSRNDDFDKELEFLRLGLSLNDSNCYSELYHIYSKGKQSIMPNKSLASQILKSAITKKIPSLFFYIGLAYTSGDMPEFTKNKEQAQFWLKKDADHVYSEYLYFRKKGDVETADFLKKRVNELIQKYDYDPSLHVDEYQAWLNDKPTTKTTSKRQTTAAKKSSSTTKYLSLPNGNSRAVITVRQPGQKEQGLNGKISIDKNLITLTPNGGTAIRIEVTGNPSDGLWSKDYPCRINGSTTDGTHKYELSVGTSAGFKSIEFWFKNKYYIVTILDL